MWRMGNGVQLSREGDEKSGFSTRLVSHTRGKNVKLFNYPERNAALESSAVRCERPEAAAGVNLKCRDPMSPVLRAGMAKSPSPYPYDRAQI